MPPPSTKMSFAVEGVSLASHTCISACQMDSVVSLAPEGQFQDYSRDRKYLKGGDLMSCLSRGIRSYAKN